MLQSPPSRRRGLKYFTQFAPMWDEDVASFSEAWIEIYNPVNNPLRGYGRLLLGGVD